MFTLLSNLFWWFMIMLWATFSSGITAVIFIILLAFQIWMMVQTKRDPSAGNKRTLFIFQGVCTLVVPAVLTIWNRVFLAELVAVFQAIVFFVLWMISLAVIGRSGNEADDSDPPEEEWIQGGCP